MGKRIQVYINETDLINIDAYVNSVGVSRSEFLTRCAIDEAERNSTLNFVSQGGRQDSHDQQQLSLYKLLRSVEADGGVVYVRNSAGTKASGVPIVGTDYVEVDSMIFPFAAIIELQHLSQTH